LKLRLEDIAQDPSVARMLSRKSLSEETRKSYLKGIRAFCEFHCAPPSELLARLKGAGGDGLVEAFSEWFAHLKDRVAPKSAWAWLPGVKAWLQENNVKEVDRVSREIAREFRRKFGGLRTLLRRDAIGKEEIVQVLKAAGRRERAIITLMASSGLRLSAALRLQLKHFKDDIWNPSLPCYAVEIPEALSKEGLPYITFISAEAARSVREYLEDRRREGEELGPESYLFAVARGRGPLTARRFENIWRELCRRAGLDMRPVQIKGYHPVGRKGGGVELRSNSYRYNVRVHSLRKFFKTTCSVLGVDRMAAEAMMGHSLSSFGVESLYDYCTSNLDYLREQYLRALPGLTFLEPPPAAAAVNGEARRKVDELSKIIAERELEIRRLREELERLRGIEERVRRIETSLGASYEARIVPEEELERYLAEGWDFVRELSNGRYIVRRLRPAQRA
jgi:integrase/uncharacterized coiled-coil protein SlyX